MEYLKCSNCGRLNELQNEYLTFCIHCKKKLDNNFQDWLKGNAGKSFAEYKKQVAVSGDVLPAGKKPVKKKVELKYWIGFIIFFALCTYIGSILGDKPVASQNVTAGKEVSDEHWVKQVIGEMMTVETPGKMTKTEMPLPESAKDKIEKSESYETAGSNGFKVTVLYTKFNPQIGEISLQAAAEGAIEQMKARPGVTDFVYQEESITRDKIPGVVESGSFKLAGTEFQFIDASFASEMNFWQVISLYESSDEHGKAAAEKVLESARFTMDNSTATP